MKKIAALFLGVLSLLLVNSANAWQHEISIGYGFGKETEENYYNRGGVLSAKLYKFRPIDNTLIVTLDGTISHWTANTDKNKQLTTVALAPDFRAYFLNPNCFRVRPYLGASFGPTYLSAERFGNRNQSSHFVFQTTIGGGTEIGIDRKRAIDLNLHLAHYCNAGLFRQNQGINILYIMTLGYQF